MSTSEIDAGRALISYGRQFYDRGWMWATAGNLSVRLGGSQFLVTPSGVPKGSIEPEQMIVIGEERPRWVSPSTQVPGIEPRPSAETEIHRMLYKNIPECGAVMHVHPAAATYISGVFGDAEKPRLLPIEWIEIMKAVGFEEGQTGQLPIFPNWQDIPKLADQVQTFLHSSSEKKIPAFLIYNHGLTAWGRTMDEARNHLETIEFVCDQRYRALCAAQTPAVPVRY